MVTIGVSPLVRGVSPLDASLTSGERPPGDRSMVDAGEGPSEQRLRRWRRASKHIHRHRAARGKSRRGARRYPFPAWARPDNQAGNQAQPRRTDKGHC